MPRLDDYAHPLWRDLLLDRFGDLAGHSLLNLQPAGKHVHKSRDFAEAQHFVARKIGYVRFPEKWQHVVLTQAEELDILYHDHFIVGNTERCTIQNVIHILVIAAGQKLERLL